MKIITDSCCDLTAEFILENEIKVLPLSLIIDGKEGADDLTFTKKHAEYYESMRQGVVATTSQVNVHQFLEVFEEYAKLEEEVIYIGFTSVLSGCISSAYIALEQVKETYKDAKIAIVDSKCVCMGLGLLVYYAIQKIKEGNSWKEVVDYLEDNKNRVNHWITPEDLVYFLRGGRLSKTACAVGTILGIKPIIITDMDGRLKVVDKVKGRKKSIKCLAEKSIENIVVGKTDIIFIAHGGCEKDANMLKSLIEEQFKTIKIVIDYIGGVMGAHAGPGTIGVFFMGNEREV